jgi:hypothetical protein
MGTSPYFSISGRALTIKLTDGPRLACFAIEIKSMTGRTSSGANVRSKGSAAVAAVMTADADIGPVTDVLISSPRLTAPTIVAMSWLISLYLIVETSAAQV